MFHNTSMSKFKGRYANVISHLERVKIVVKVQKNSNNSSNTHTKETKSWDHLYLSFEQGKCPPFAKDDKFYQ